MNPPEPCPAALSQNMLSGSCLLVNVHVHSGMGGSIHVPGLESYESFLTVVE